MHWLICTGLSSTTYSYLVSKLQTRLYCLKFPNNRRLERIVFHKFFFLSVPQQPKKAILAKANNREGFLFQNTEAQKLILTKVCPQLKIRYWTWSRIVTLRISRLIKNFWTWTDYWMMRNFWATVFWTKYKRNYLNLPLVCEWLTKQTP